MNQLYCSRYTFPPTNIALGEPKTKGSRRTVYLTGAAVKALKTHLELQLEDIERLGDLYRDDGLVFTWGVGTLINPSNLRRRSFARLLKRAGLPQIRFHDLRHTCATLLLSRNVHPEYVQDFWAMPPWRSRWTPIPT